MELIEYRKRIRLRALNNSAFRHKEIARIFPYKLKLPDELDYDDLREWLDNQQLVPYWHGRAEADYHIPMAPTSIRFKSHEVYTVALLGLT